MSLNLLGRLRQSLQKFSDITIKHYKFILSHYWPRFRNPVKTELHTNGDTLPANAPKQNGNGKKAAKATHTLASSFDRLD